MLPGNRRVAASSWVVVALVVFCLLAGCRKSDEPSERVFASPDLAGAALLEGAKSGDQNALLTIFGSGSKELISSGDAVQDKATVEGFAAAYETMHRWRKMPDGGQILLIGADKFPFPIPLEKNGDGQWFFDTAAGKDEILNRRIGRNELAIINVCVGLAESQAEVLFAASRCRTHEAIRFEVHQRSWQTERLVLEVA